MVFLQEMSSMEAIEEQKAQEDGDVYHVLSRQAEFHRLSLGFKCDMFTLEKRLRLEERSRDLAEENVRKEVNSSLNITLCFDNQSMEIIHRLQKNLEVLIQSMTRVSSRSEMLGAVHQETRVGKTVEVMIQHVDNLRRMYTKEHAELLELRENLTPNERSFGNSCHFSHSSKCSMFSLQVASAVSPIQTHFYLFFLNVLFITCYFLMKIWPRTYSTHKYASASGYASLILYNTLLPAAEDMLVLFFLNISFTFHPSPSPSPTDHTPPSLTDGRPAVSRGTRGIWIWVALLVVLAVLLALLASLMLQPAVDAAPVGTGDSWMTIQQLLWPYTGLRHNGQPPV
uniref:Lymphoid restricted membrane protein n=1 Tax=Sinocyclocheilus grahami TaxID=75366 RepID=A0A672QBY7_SINGR